MPDEEEQDPKGKPLNLKTIVFIVVGILIIGAIWYGYYWINSTQAKVKQAEDVIDKAAAYDVLSENLQNEYQRCQAFISQEEGQFGQFQYCQEFINFINTQTELEQ